MLGSVLSGTPYIFYEVSHQNSVWTVLSLPPYLVGCSVLDFIMLTTLHDLSYPNLLNPPYVCMFPRTFHCQALLLNSSYTHPSKLKLPNVAQIVCLLLCLLSAKEYPVMHSNNLPSFQLSKEHVLKCAWSNLATSSGIRVKPDLFQQVLLSFWVSTDQACKTQTLNKNILQPAG